MNVYNFFTAHPHFSQRRPLYNSYGLSVFRSFVQTNEDTIVFSPASGRTIILVSGKVQFIRIFAGNHPQRGR